MKHIKKFNESDDFPEEIEIQPWVQKLLNKLPTRDDWQVSWNTSSVAELDYKHLSMDRDKMYIGMNLSNSVLPAGHRPCHMRTGAARSDDRRAARHPAGRKMNMVRSNIFSEAGSQNLQLPQSLIL